MTPATGTKLTKVPAIESRPETGPMQFGEDWPGVFIRGDNALYFASCLSMALSRISLEEPILRAAIKGIAATLRSCDAANFREDGP